MSLPLDGVVAVVTGASRGVGKGIALGLGEAGATVYVTGRSVEASTLPGTVGETAAEVTRLGGRGIALPCDHGDDAAVKAVFEREPERLGFNPQGGESPQLSGRAVAALAADPQRMAKTGQALVVAELALEYGFKDIDGSQPESLRRRD
jgi:NAD(P)-dependent dehydrogenase (short-subunit alcohol dehydrogenase family)